MKTESPFGGVSSPYAVGRIRALEGGLLDRARWNRLIEAPDERQAIRLLREFGYGGGADALDGMIRRELEDAQSLIREISPDPELTGLFLLSVDAHNLKALLKARVAAMEAGPLLLQGGKYPVEMLEACVKSDNFHALGGALARELKDVEAIREPRLLSAAVDRAVYAEILETVRRRHAPLLREYFETQAACLNRLAALRGKRLGWDAKTLAPMLLPLPPVKEDDPVPVLPVTLEEDDSPAQAEQKINRMLTAILRREKYDAFGVAPLIWYLQARRNEASSLRILFARKREGRNPPVEELLFE